MTLILEPCCFRKQLDELLTKIERKSETAHFFTFGDFSLPEFMDYFIGRSSGCDVFLSLVRVELPTLLAIDKLMKRKDKKGDFIIHSFTLLSQGKDKNEINNVLSAHRSSGRMAICEDAESFRCLSVGNKEHNYVLNGSINQVPVFSMQMFTLTTSSQLYEDVACIFNMKKRNKST